MDGQNDLQRLIYYEAMREKCNAEYLRSPHDPENLTNWGNALIELSQFQQGEDSLSLLEEAISKLEAAMKINPKRHETLWSLGNALICRGFILPAGMEANEEFKKASGLFQEAYTESPCDLYSKYLEMAEKAPLLHQEIQAQFAATPVGSSSSSDGSKSVSGSNRGKKKKSSKRTDLAYDIMGWVVLAVGVMVWVGTVQRAPNTSPM